VAHDEEVVTLHVGLSLTFQNYAGARSDQAVWADEVRLAERAIELGFDGIWATEHHFTDYEITPDPLQFLTYVAARYMGNYYRAVVEHYGFTRESFAATKGYEHYAKISNEMADGGTDRVIDDFTDVQVWGTPAQCMEKIVWLCELVGSETFLPVFGYGGMSTEQVRGSMELFAREVMPGLQALPGLSHPA
jgi:alkanesulfonate monooxygenase SsuD/methylene tetrahydromethanopterin reductase-like flavin-dependent oxidoreductase (luciferase family)